MVCELRLRTDVFDDAALEAIHAIERGCEYDVRAPDVGHDRGHDAVPRGDHLDHLVVGRLHHPHEDHCDDHGPLALA